MMGCKGVPERVTEQRREVVEMIVSDMQEKGFEWHRAWADALSPCNPISGTVYRGGNRFHLAAIARKRGYADPRWVTFNQAKKAGWKLRKGAKSAIIEKWKSYTVAADGEASGDDGEDAALRTFLRCVGYWSVFNASEFEGAPAFDAPDYSPTDDEVGRIADGFMETSRCRIEETMGGEACYMPWSDRIRLPLRGQFDSNAGFLRVLLHEMTHSTMHEATPAARSAKGRFGSPEYAFEELIAELGSVFTAADADLPISADESAEHYRQHVAYLQSWIAALDDDASYVFKAAAMAEKAADYLLERYRDAG